MKEKDISIKINKTLWERVVEKIKIEFGQSYYKNGTDCLLIVMLLLLYKPKKSKRSDISLSHIYKHPSELYEDNYMDKTISIYDGILEEGIKQYNK